jgi:hypothetical protein
MFTTHLTILFPPLKIKLKDRHFDTTEVIQTESQAVLSTLTEHDSKIHFKMAQVLGTVHTRGRGLIRGWWWWWRRRPVGPKLALDQMTASVPVILDGCSETFKSNSFRE